MKLRIYGNIKDTKTSQAMIDAIIKLFLDKKEIQEVKSIKNGFFEIITEIDDSRIESGQQLRVTIEKKGYEKQEHRLLATEGSFNLDVNLETAAPPPKKPFNWLPVIIAGGGVILLLIIGIVVLLVLQPPKLPEITSFFANPNSIEPGQSAALSWKIKNASSVQMLIDSNMVSLESDGNKQVQPTQTTEYKLIAKGKKGEEITKSQIIEVKVITPQPQIVHFEASKTTIKKGEQSILRWETANAVDVQINPDVGGVGASGSKTVIPNQTSTYKLIAKNEKGDTVEKTIPIQVLIIPPPQIVSFEAIPSTIKKGEKSTLKWNTANAVDVKINPNVGDVGASGSKTVMPQQTTTYTLIAKNEGGKGKVEKNLLIKVQPKNHFENETISSSSNSADIITIGPNVTIAQKAQVTFKAQDSVLASRNIVIKEGAQVTFTAKNIKAENHITIKSGARVTLEATDTTTIGPHFNIESGATLIVRAGKAINILSNFNAQNGCTFESPIVSGI